jgi:valyl-tRNA synthetase
VFWRVLCDNYLEISKSRLYDLENKKSRRSAQHALYHVFLGTLKLFAPIMPYMTEELYQGYYADKKKEGQKQGESSIHISGWPEFDEKIIDDDAEKLGGLTIDIISEARKYKTGKQMSLKQELAKVVVELPFDFSKLKESELKGWKADLMSTIVAKELELRKGNELKVAII